MAQQIITQPATLAVSLDDAKRNQRINVNDTENDALILAQLAAAIRMAEEYTRRAFITQKWIYETTNLYPTLSIPRPPLQKVYDTVKYINWNGVSFAVLSNTYFLNKIFEPGRLIFKQGYFPFPIGAGAIYPWFSSNNGADNFWRGTVSLEFDCGYGDHQSDVPAEIQQGILQIFGSLYQNRESQGIPCGAKQLLDPFRIGYL